jgi:gas vesicle protein
MTKTETVATLHALRVYPATADETRKMLDELRDQLRQWQVTAKILYNQTVSLAGLLAAERRKHAKG